MQKGDIDPAPLPAPGHHRAAHLGHHFSATGYERHRTEYSLHDVELSALSAQRAALESLTQELKGVLDKVLGSDAGLRAAQPCAPPREAAATTAAGAPPPPVQAGGKPGMGAPRWNSVQDVLNRPSRRVSFSEPGGPTRGAEASSFWTAGRAQQDQEVERTGLSQVLAEVVDSGRIETPITHCAERRGRQKLYRPEMVDDFVRWVKKAGEDERQQATELTALYGATPCCRWVLLPDTVALHLWGIGLAGLIFLHAFFLPLHLAFGDDLDPTSSLRFLTFADVCFAIDIGLTFRTAVPSTQMARANAPLMETRGWRIAAHYACTWLVPDLLAALPYHLMPRRIAFSLSGAFEQDDVVASEGALAWLMLLRLLGLLRLLRVARSVEADRHHRWFGPRLELAMFFGLFMLLCHTLGCLHWFVADLELRSAMLANEEEQAASWGADGSGWLPPVRYASHVRTPGDAASASAFSCYMYALAWGAQNLIEPGQARPETIAQSTFTLVVVFFAMATQALIIGQMTTTINRMEASRNAKSAGRQVVDGYLESRDVPRKLRQRIHRFFDFVGSVSDVNAEELLENLPPQLKLQLELYHKRDVYLKNPVRCMHARVRSVGLSKALLVGLGCGLCGPF